MSARSLAGRIVRRLGRVFAATAATPVAAPGELKIDDEFAKNLGLEGLDKLKELLRGQLEQETSGLTRTQMKRQLLDTLAAAISGSELPPGKLAVIEWVPTESAEVATVQAPLPAEPMGWAKEIVTEAVSGFSNRKSFIIATLSVGYEGESLHDRLPILFELITILCTLLCLDLGKVYLSDYIGRKLSERVYAIVNRYFGVILSGIGLYFAYHFVLLLSTWLKAVKPH